jgi:hypothetical protein
VKVVSVNNKEDMNEMIMKDIKTLDKRYETIAWGAGFVWIGVLGIIPGDQSGIGILSIGLIFLGLNLARWLRKIPINGFSTTLGVLASLLGLVVLLRSALNLPPFEVDLFSLFLIVGGLYILIPAPKQADNG